MFNIVKLRTTFTCITIIAIMFAITLDAGAEEKKHDMGEIGKKLANPLADLWSLNFNTFIVGLDRRTFGHCEHS